MSKVKIQGDAGGTGTFTIAAPNSDTDRSLTLPDTAGEILTDSAIGTSVLAPDGDGSSLTAIESAITTQLSHRNLIINGDMKIAQRGTSTSSLANSGVYACADRFSYRRQGSWSSITYTMSQESDGPSGFSKSIKITSSGTETPSSSTTAEFGYFIEGQDVQHLAYGTSDAKTITLSFWVKSSLTGKMCVNFRNENVGKVYTTYVTISSANTWEYKTITVSGDTANGFTNSSAGGFRIYWGVASGISASGVTFDSWISSSAIMLGTSAEGYIDISGTSGASAQITGVQLEVGSVATPFEHRSYGEELARCQRYYFRNNNEIAGKSIGSGFFYNSTVGFTHYDFPVTMRAAPSKSYSGLSDFRVLYGTGVKTPTDSDTISGKHGARLGWTASSLTAGEGFMVDANNNTGWIAFDAEV